ncbi:MAG TPA: hypothetical protein VJ948_03005 [Acidimicrobiia bacterium]|nr:hypothetical protein [Acidimicrobiia bacterium]
MPGESDLDSINLRLAEIAALLSGPAHTPSREHFALLTERDRLRAEAARYRPRKDESRSVADLGAELAELPRRRKTSVGSRTGYVTAKGGNNQGPDGGAWVKLAVQSFQASDITRLTARISEIEDELARRKPTE